MARKQVAELIQAANTITGEECIDLCENKQEDIQKLNKDFRSWSEVKTQYFFEQDYDRIFQIEWEKFVMLDEYQKKFRDKLIRESFY